MSYTNPLSIFTAAQVKSLSPENLKSLKKETLLYFQLSDEATIERNGRHLDKNQVLEIFDTLQVDLELHLKIYNNKPLLEFLEYQKMDFFTHEESQGLVLNDHLHKTQINDILAEEVNKYTSSILTNVRFSALGQLKVIGEYVAKAGPSFQDKAFTKSYRELKAFVDKTREQYPTPFVMDEGLAFHPDLDKQVNPLLYRCFDFLPGPFRDIGFLYAAWCHNVVVNKALTRETDFTKYKRLNLKTISKAIEIAVNVSDTPSLRKTNFQIKEILKGKAGKPRQAKKRPANPSRNKPDQGSGLPKLNMYYAKVGLLVVLAIITLLMLASKFTGNNYTEVDPPSQVVEQERPLDTKAKRLETDRTRNSQNTTSESSKSVTAKYVGDDLENCKAVFVNSEAINGILHLNYNVEIFPTRTDQLYEFIPTSIREQYKGMTKKFRVNFYNKNLQGRIFSHDFNATLEPEANGKITEYVYDGRHKGNLRDEIALPSSRLPRKKVLQGTISKFDITTNEKTNTQTFDIKIDNSITPLPRKPSPYGNDPEVLTEEVDHSKFTKESFRPWHKYRISNNIDQNYKDIILHNFNQIAFKSSRMGQNYSIPFMATYRPMDAGSSEFKASKLSPTRGWQRSYTQSMADNVAIFHVVDDRLEMRIFVSKSSQMLLGWHMATMSSDGKVVELMEVFFE